MEKQSIFNKILEASKAKLDTYILKAKDAKGLSDDLLYRRSLYIPPYDPASAMGYKERASRVTEQSLKLMSYRDSIIAAIIKTRINQISLFSRPQVNKHDSGYIICRKDEKDMAKDDEKKITYIREFVNNTGINDDRPSQERFSFDEFLRRAIRDRLTYSQIAFERIFDKKGDLHHIVPVDASTIRYAALASTKDNKLEFVNTVQMGDNVNKLIEAGEMPPEPTGEEGADYVQVYNNEVKRVFNKEDLVFKQANPVNDMDSKGYSMGELELLLNIVTSHLNAENYNKLFFSQGHVAKGMLHIQSNITTRQIEAFRKQWYAQTTGNRNSWRTPVLSTPADGGKIEWINLQQSNRDMEFGLWMNYLIKMCCHPKNTEILTPNGYINIEDIKPNDLIISHKGKEQKVLNIQKKQYEGDMYIISGMGYKNIEATEEHPFLVAKIINPHTKESTNCFARDFYKENYKKELIWKKAKELKIDDRLVCPKIEEAPIGDCYIDATKYLDGLDIEYNEDTIWIDGARIHIPRWYNLSGFFGELVGWYIAEGHAINNYCSFAISEDDEKRWNTITKIKDYFQKIGIQIKEKRMSDSDKCFRLQINSKIMSYLLANLCGRGSANKHIPNNINWTQETIFRILKGYCRGDGYISTNSVRISSISKQLIYDIRWLLLKLGIFSAITFEEAKETNGRNYKPSWHLAFSGKRAQKKLTFFNFDENTKETYLNDNDYFYLNIQNIEKREANEIVYNFEVENDNSYIANSVASHNCALYAISPEEIGFDISKETSSGQGSMFESNVEKRIKSSKDKGLRPELRFLEDMWNEAVIDKLDPTYKLKFVGLDSESRIEETERQSKESKYLKTIDELRAEENQKPLGKENGGDIIQSPEYIQWLMAKEGREQAQQYQEQGGGIPGNEEELSDEDMEEVSGEEVPEEKAPPIEDEEKSFKKSKDLNLVKVEYYKEK